MIQSHLPFFTGTELKKAVAILELIRTKPAYKILVSTLVTGFGFKAVFHVTLDAMTHSENDWFMQYPCYLGTLLHKEVPSSMGVPHWKTKKRRLCSLSGCLVVTCK